MKWLVKQKSKPVQGSTRWVKRFAFFPHKVDGTWWVWLERYAILEEYHTLKQVATRIGTVTREGVWVTKYESIILNGKKLGR